MNRSVLKRGGASAADTGGPASPVVVGRVVKPVGLTGAVKAEVLSDAPDRFAEGAELWVLTAPPVRARVERVRAVPDGRVVLQFCGRSSLDEVGAWRGCYLAIEESERARLPEDAFYHDELKGMSVGTETGARVGVIRNVWSSGPYDLLACDDGGTERLLPMIKEFVVRVDRARRHVVVRPPAGWMDDVAV
ncbi:MAG: ribosome maturation factor RimM [Nitrospirota bacterium]